MIERGRILSYRIRFGGEGAANLESNILFTFSCVNIYDFAYCQFPLLIRNRTFFVCVRNIQHAISCESHACNTFVRNGFPIAMNIYAKGIFNFKNMKYFQSAALMHYVKQKEKRYKTHKSYQVPTLGPVITH